MTEDRRRSAVPGYIWAYARRRWYYLAVATVLVTVVLVLLSLASPLPEYGKNLSLNIGADLIGTIVVLFIIAPFIARGELRSDAVLERFDHSTFIRQTADARQRVLILELWTDLLQGSYKRPFLDSMRQALRQDVRIRILLLDPDARAAEQRADDLRLRTDVADNIMENLQVLQEFLHDLPERLQRNIEIRVYSALPPVQMYRVDNRALVSFFPVNTTSWNVAQYQTSPHTQLGTFVGAKFDELWEARSTRTLEQFRAITITVDADQEEDERSYRVQFVIFHDERYVSGQEVVAGYAKSGIGGLSTRVTAGNARGQHEVSGPYSFAPVDPGSQDWAMVRELFVRKYGHDRREVILKLVEESSE